MFQSSLCVCKVYSADCQLLSPARHAVSYHNQSRLYRWLSKLNCHLIEYHHLCYAQMKYLWPLTSVQYHTYIRPRLHIVSCRECTPLDSSICEQLMSRHNVSAMLLPLCRLYTQIYTYIRMSLPGWRMPGWLEIVHRCETVLCTQVYMYLWAKLERLLLTDSPAVFVRVCSVTSVTVNSALD